MNTKKTGAPESAPVSFETQRKDTHYYQFQQTQVAFFSEPRTMMWTAKQVGIDRANVCWYVRDLRTAGAIWLIRKGKCPITHAKGVGFWTTNPKYAEGLPQQLKLF